jgi:N-acetylmuramoyl-L-alanine amidase
MTLTQSAFLHYSEVLSTQIEERFRTHLGLNSRGVKQAGFYVLWGASMPAVLIELGFITNPTDHERMRTSSGRRQYAEAIAASILGFREQYQQEIN